MGLGQRRPAAALSPPTEPPMSTLLTISLNPSVDASIRPRSCWRLQNKRALLQRWRHGKNSFRAPNQGVESSLRFWTAGEGAHTAPSFFAGRRCSCPSRVPSRPLAPHPLPRPGRRCRRRAPLGWPPGRARSGQASRRLRPAPAGAVSARSSARSGGATRSLASIRAVDPLTERDVRASGAHIT